MAKRSDDDALAGLLGLTNHSVRKSHYPELSARLAELEAERNRYKLLNDELEKRVAERTCQLREARDAAEAANRSKDKYLAAASHDLLQPLNAARLLVSTLRERALAPDDALLVERTQQALDGAEELLTDLLDIARLDQAGVIPDVGCYSLAEVLGPLATEFEPQARSKGIEWRARIGSGYVQSDLRLLTRILRNFLSNACRYTDRGGILLSARRRGDYLRLEVWDSGRGIAQESLQSIFEAFRQLPVPRHQTRQGVGLGLAIVEGIARVLGHRIIVRSWPSRGSVFALEVPLAAAPSEQWGVVANQSSQLGDPLPGRRILVIDNEASIRFSMQALLQQWGCQVILARDLEQAIAALEGSAPDVILADYHLDQGQTGSEAVEHLRGCFKRALPAIMITADRSDDCRDVLRESRIALLNKPVRPGKLRAAIGACLAG